MCTGRIVLRQTLVLCDTTEVRKFSVSNVAAGCGPAATLDQYIFATLHGASCDGQDVTANPLYCRSLLCPTSDTAVRET